MEYGMEDPQVIIEKLKIAQTYTNSALGIELHSVGTSADHLENQTKAWIDTFNKVYKDILP